MSIGSGIAVTTDPKTAVAAEEAFLRRMEDRLDAAEGKTPESQSDLGQGHMQVMAADFCMNGRRLIAMARKGVARR